MTFQNAKDAIKYHIKLIKLHLNINIINDILLDKHKIIRKNTTTTTLIITNKFSKC